MTQHFHRIKKAALAHHRAAVQSFNTTHRHAKRLFRKHKVTLRKVRKHALRSSAIAGASMSVLAGPVLAATAPPQAPVLPDANELQHALIVDHEGALGLTAKAPTGSFGPAADQASTKGQLAGKISSLSPTYTQLLTGDQESNFSGLIKQYWGIDAKAQLDNMRLNAVEGIMAGEQHLPLYPGDNLSDHTSDANVNLSGMTPDTRAWGYYANSQAEVTQKMIMNERYYIAAQTWMSPGWTPEKNAWYKDRKVVVIYPSYNENKVYGVVASIGDAGPNPSLTSFADGQRDQRNFGGSPEVMDALGPMGLNRSGHVYVFFVDDPNDTIPLGPLQIQ
jgi:hypothetical protein